MQAGIVVLCGSSGIYFLTAQTILTRRGAVCSERRGSGTSGFLFGSTRSTPAEVSIESRKLVLIVCETLVKLDKMAEDNSYESILCVKPEVHVYRIPPRASNRGYR